MRMITKIIVHCSDSAYGDADLINRWHKQRGWRGIGYHRVILNGYLSRTASYNVEYDGLVQLGRGLDEVGAHCRGENQNSIGICLIGRRLFTPSQLLIALPNLLGMLINTFNLTPQDIYGHRDFNSQKTCPNIETALLRELAGG